MTQPFVVSYKITGTDAGGGQAARQVRQEVEALQRSAMQLAAGNSTPDIDKLLGIKDGAGSVAAYRQGLDDLRASFVPLVAHERQHEANLAAIATAHRLGAITADEQSAAIDRENAAHQRAIAALDGHTHAVNVNAAANGRAMAQRANLIFQLNDIFVSLASGMNPAMVAIQQGSQIATIYGPGEGGIGAAFRETGNMAASAATKFWPIAVAAAAIGVAVGGMRHEIEEASGVAVSFGDTFMAVFQVLGGYLYNAFKPQIEAIKDWWDWTWQGVIDGTKWVGNGIISRFNTMYVILEATVKSIPDMFLVAGEEAANFFIDGIEQMVRDAATHINSLLGPINAIRQQFKQEPIQLFDPASISLPDVDIGGEAALERLSAGWNELDATVKDIQVRDYMGEFFGDVQQQAIANYNAGLDDTSKKARSVANGLKIADDAAKAFKETMDFGRDTFRSFVQEMRSGLSEGKDFWEVFGSAGLNALDKIADRMFGFMADSAFNNLVSMFLPGFGQTGGTMGNGLWGSAIFNAKGNVFAGSPSLSAFSNKIVDRPTMFAFAAGAGVMGEAGPEAILPLKRTGSGALGVQVANDNRGAGGAAATVVNELVVHNFSSGATVRQGEESDRRGGRKPNYVVEDMVAGALARPRSPAQRAAGQMGRVTRR